ncbi:MAG: hypothetical protein GF401_20470 [Chitinivibrionales bacterium]|nr:hypothetical protein [Chitinivibrionales bacterium]
MRNQIYYLARPAMPRWVQIALRRFFVKLKIKRIAQEWPIHENSAPPPPQWKGWPDNKQFAFVITHDVELQIGCDRAIKLAELDRSFGFTSSFNFVPERYTIDPSLFEKLQAMGCEIGIHGLKHDGRLYETHNTFNARAKKINDYIKQWNVTGFRSPSMHYNLEWIADLDINYDASTFEFDPFEPQIRGVGTIFPFIFNNHTKSYVELPYTLPQDFTVFILMQEKSPQLWKKKLDWIAEHGGMALFITHPDYIALDSSPRRLDEYPPELYSDFLRYVKERYEGRYWHALPKEISRFWKENYSNTLAPEKLEELN